MRLLIAVTAAASLVSSCAWDNSTPPLHSRIWMERSGRTNTVAGAGPVDSTNYHYRADFDTNKIQGAGGGSLFPARPASSTGAASLTPGATVNSTPAAGAAASGLGGTGAGASSSASPNSAQPAGATPGLGTSGSTSPGSSSGTRTVP